MTVEELIIELSKFPSDKQVVGAYWIEDYHVDCEIEQVEHLTLVNAVRVCLGETVDFRDNRKERR